MNREELIAYDRWLTENKWGSSEIITPEQAADLYLAKHPLPPAEGAEQRIRVRNILQDFYRRGEYELEQAEEDIMRLFQPQPTAEGADPKKVQWSGYGQLGNISQKPLHPTAEGAGKTCHAKEMEYNHNMCAMQESCEKCEAYKVPTNEGDIAKTETDTGRIVDMPDLSQPTAEGAEEIIESIVESLGEPINIHNHIFEIRPYTVKHKTEWWIFHKEVGSGEPLAQWLQNFATLHAQRIAEKMVEEKLKKEYERGIEDGKIIGKHGSVSYIE